jgi:hypothetical protein
MLTETRFCGGTSIIPLISVPTIFCKESVVVSIGAFFSWASVKVLHFRLSGDWLSSLELLFFTLNEDEKAD